MTDQVEQRIYEHIREHGYAFGDLLPKEEEFAAELSVSRTITREALSRLKAAGIIESRRRRGMILKKPDLFAGLDKLIHFNILDETARKEFAELRLVIEIGLSDLIYMHKTPEALDELEKIARRFIDSKEHGKIEQEFHRRLMAMSQNRLIDRFQLLLDSVFVSAKELSEEVMSQAYGDHMEIVEALRSGTLAEWREVAHQHFTNYF